MRQKHIYSISIVVIGFNEEKNLDNTFNAIRNMNYPQTNVEIIYIDSGSTDRSIEIAGNFTDKIFIEKNFPSPGRNRNRGLIEARYDIIHFLDGDVILDQEYLSNVIPIFEEKGVSAIVGQLDEQNPNLFNRLSWLSNNEKIEGYIDFTSTGGTYLKQPLLNVNGYDERIIRGQETDLGIRFRERGYKIWCTNYRLGSHNFDVTNLWDYMKKYRVDAKICVKNSLLKYDNKYMKPFKKVFKNNCIKLVIYILSLMLSIILNNSLIIGGCYIFDYLTKYRRHFIRFFKTHNKLILIELIISFFIIPLYYYSFIKELLNYTFNQNAKKYYNLRKMELNEKIQ